MTSVVASDFQTTLYLCRPLRKKRMIYSYFGEFISKRLFINSIIPLLMLHPDSVNFYSFFPEIVYSATKRWFILTLSYPNYLHPDKQFVLFFHEKTKLQYITYNDLYSIIFDQLCWFEIISHLFQSPICMQNFSSHSVLHNFGFGKFRFSAGVTSNKRMFDQFPTLKIDLHRWLTTVLSVKFNLIKIRSSVTVTLETI